MALGYTKEFLVDAFCARYDGVKTAYDLRNMANLCYDTVGKDKFRQYASLDAEAIKSYKTKQKQKEKA